MRSSILAACLALSSAVPLVSSFDVHGQLFFSAVFPNTSEATLGSRVSLDHGARYAYIAATGEFSLPNVDEGTHILEGQVPGYLMESVLLTINETIHVQPYHPARSPLPLSVPSLPYPILLRPVVKEDYFVPVSGVNVLGMLKSPMVLMMIFSGVMMLGLPKINEMMENDPELKAEVAATRKHMSGMQSSFMGRRVLFFWPEVEADAEDSLTNSISGGDDAPPVPPKSQASTPSKGNNSNGGKKRRGK